MGYIELKNVTYTYPLAKESSIKEVTFLPLKRRENFMLWLERMEVERLHCAILSVDLFRAFSGELEGEVLLEGKSLQEYTMENWLPKSVMYFKILSTRLQEPETMCMRKLPMDWKI